MHRNKLLLIVATTLLSFSMAGCGSSGAQNPSVVDINTNTENKLIASSVSVVSALDALSALDHMPVFNAPSFTNEQKEDIKKILYQVDSMLHNKSGVSISEKPSTKSEYTCAFSVNYTTTALDSSSYDVFYNIVKQEEFVEDDEKERLTTLKGIVVTNEKEYSLESLISEEVEGEEKEATIKYIIKEEGGFQIRAEQEDEVEPGESEKSFEYALYNNNTLLTRYEIEIEKVGSKDEIELFYNNTLYKITHSQIGENECYSITLNSSSDELLSFRKDIRVDENGNSYVTFEELK